MKNQAILCKIFLFAILTFLFINVRMTEAHSVGQAELGAITTVNAGTDRIMEILAESPSKEAVKSEQENYKQPEVYTDIETFYPHSRSKVKDSRDITGKEDNTTTKIVTSINGGVEKLETAYDGEVKNKIVGADIAYIRELPTSSGTFIIGGVVDYTQNNFDLNDTTEEGKSSSITAGIVAKQMKSNGFYYEGSIRTGKTDTELNNSDCNFDKSVGVYAGHLKLGKIVKMDENNKMDIYGAYAFSHQKNTKIIADDGEKYECGSLDSNRFRVGCRVTNKVKNSKFYYGVAYECETSSSIKLRHEDNLYDTNASGNSGLVELGYQISASKNDSVNINLNATGYAGNKKGGIFNIKFTKSF